MENRRKSKRGAANESNEDEEIANGRKKHMEVFKFVMKELLTKSSKKFLKFFRIRPAIQFKYDSKNKENKETKKQKQDKDSSCVERNARTLDANGSEVVGLQSGQNQPEESTGFFVRRCHAPGATLKRHKSVKNIEKIPCKDILVSGFSKDTSEDDIVMYFQSKKSDGGDAEMMFFDKNKNCAVVSFDEFQVAEKVISRDHTLRDKNLSVEKYLSTTLSFCLETLSCNSVSESLTRLVKELQSNKAFCNIDETSQELEVVCSEAEHEEVSTIVKEFLKTIRKEEIRKTYKTETVKGIDQHLMLFLEEIGFLDDIKTDHPELYVNFDIEGRQLCLKGPDDQLHVALKKYNKIMESIIFNTFDLDKTLNFDKISDELWQNYFPAKFAGLNIKAKIFDDKASDKIKLVAASSLDYDKAQRLYHESIMQDKVPFSKENADVVQGEKCKELFLKLKHGFALDICVEMSTSLVKLFGVQEFVPNAKKEIENFIEVERMRSKTREVSNEEARLLTGHLSSKVKDIEEGLKHNKVSIQIDQAMGKVHMRGTQEGLEKCDQRFAELLAQIVKKIEEFFSPGLHKLLSEGNFSESLRLIEMEKKVAITVKIRDRQPMKMEPPPIKPKPSRSRNVVPGRAPKHLVYNQCNFTTKEGCKVSWKYGSIENEAADVLVSSAHSNLNMPTAIGRALNSRGGAKLVDACKEHTNIPEGDIVCTESGDLRSNFVIHAVCCKWDTQGKALELLRGLVRKILCKCIELHAHSVAMPAIGTGRHGFPEKEVFKTIEEEVKKVSEDISFSSYPKNIRVIVFDAQQQTTSQHMSLPALPRLTNKPNNTGSQKLSFGPVRIFLDEGDITRHQADAIINVLPNDLELSSGGGVCRSILKAGGPTIQQELKGLRRRLPGSVFLTSAGSMTNVKKILHFVPISTDVKGLQTMIEKCLNEAKGRSLSSVSIPAIGTAVFNVSSENSANLILNAAKNFSSTNHPLDIKIVVFQRVMVSHFETAIQKRVKDSVKNAESQLQRTCSFLSLSSETTTTSNQLKTFTVGELSKVMVLHFVAASQQNIDESIKKVKEFIERNTERKEIRNEKVGEVLEKHKSEVQSLARKYSVLITCSSSGAACIKGTMRDVSDCKDELFARYLSDTRLPAHWDRQPAGQTVHIVPLSKNSEEYKQVLKHFTSTGGRCDKIQKIERIQNPGLYRAYLMKKQSMNSEENEMQLFHGTKPCNTQYINANNFNRGFAGINGNKYGNGVYFARNASYSLDYSRWENKGPFTMYVVKVLVGQFIAGSQGMKAPPPRNDSGNPGRLYDSVVDKVEDPSIFVIFVDNQCYPEYLITFT